MSDRLSLDLDSQIAACLFCEGDELQSQPADYGSALDEIRVWFEHDLASASAGVEGSQSNGRKRLLNRIDAAIEDAPPHVRVSRSAIASRARTVAASQQGAATEAELDSLAHSTLPDHEWLELVAGLESTHVRKKRDAYPTNLTIHALLLGRERR